MSSPVRGEVCFPVLSKSPDWYGDVWEECKTSRSSRRAQPGNGIREGRGRDGRECVRCEERLIRDLALGTRAVCIHHSNRDEPIYKRTNKRMDE